MITKRKLRVRVTKRKLIKPNFTYWKFIWYELTCKMAFMVQSITVNNENLVKKRESNHSIIAA